MKIRRTLALLTAASSLLGGSLALATQAQAATTTTTASSTSAGDDDPVCKITGASPTRVAIGPKGNKRLHFGVTTDCPDPDSVQWEYTAHWPDPSVPNAHAFIRLATFEDPGDWHTSFDGSYKPVFGPLPAGQTAPAFYTAHIGDHGYDDTSPTFSYHTSLTFLYASRIVDVKASRQTAHRGQKAML